MTHFKKFIAAVALTLSTYPAFTSEAENVSPMSQAVINAYTGLIADDPSDYMSYYARANEYYNANDYVKALDDVNSALRYLPGSESDMRSQCLITRANIYDRLHRYADALTDLRASLSINPDCNSCLFRIATMEYELGHYSEARQSYERLRRLFPRDPNIIFGLARVAVKENNLGLAADFADEAVGLSVNKGEAYIQRAGIRSLMSNNEGAVDDYIMAITDDDQYTSSALRSLIKLSNTAYPAVINGLSRAIKAAPRVGAYYYIRASIAQAHGNYLTAINDLNTILNDNLDGYSGLNYSLAECYYALGRYDHALTNIDYAIGSAENNPGYFAMKARIRNALADYDGAVFAADKALSLNPDYTDALVAKALAMTGKSDFNEASALLAQAIMTKADDPELYMLRAWIARTLQNQPNVAEALYLRVLDLPSDFDQLNSLRGFALLFSGDEIGAERWISSLISTTDDATGLPDYYAACLYAHAGNTAKAFDYMESSLKKGYANYHRWMTLNDGLITVEPLRNLPRFKELITKYAIIFGR